MRQANTRVAGCAFHDSTTRLQQTLLLCIQDNVQGGAVLDATAWLHEFGLTVYV